jgi:polar amino acid transport system substrate-binding protein
MRDVQLADSGGVIVGPFPPGEPAAPFGLAFAKGSPLVACVNLALASIREDGTLEAIYQEWLADRASAPVISG